MLPATVEKRTNAGVRSPAALEEVGPREVGKRLVGLEEPVRSVAAGVHDPLGDALVVEVEDLLAEVEVLQQRRPALADPQGVLVVGDRDALRGRQHRLAWRRWCVSPPVPTSNASSLTARGRRVGDFATRRGVGFAWR